MRKHIILGILLKIGIPSFALSDVETSDTTARMLNTVVVTSKATAETKSAAPLRKLDKDLIAKVGVTDVSDALHRMPGVTLRDYGGAGGLKTVSIRGFGTGHTGVIFDGVPLSDVQSGQIDLSRYSIDNVNSVSMIIGDNDDIFVPARFAASAATVNISSQPVIDQTELNAKLSTGSYGYVNPFLRIGTPLSHTSGINFVGDFTHADNNYPFKLKNGTITTTERRNNSRMNSGHGEVNFICKPDHLSTLTTKIYYYDNSRRLPGPVIYYNNVNKESLRDRNAFAQAQLKRTFSSKVSMMGVAKFNFASSFYHDINGKYPGGELSQKYWQREYYASMAWLYLPCKDVAIDYSADYFYNNLNSNLVTNRRPYRNSILQSLTARYRSSQLSVMARMLYSIYDNGTKAGEAAKDASKFSPSLCLSYQPLKSQLLFIRASYKNIFRMPTFTECYFDHYGSTDILPESTNQINLGITYNTKSTKTFQASFTIDGYSNRVKDMIVAVPYNMFIWSMVNLGKVHILGLDATTSINFIPAKGHSIFFTANYSYQRAMPRTNRDAMDWMKQVAYIPVNSGSSSISYENPWVNFTFYGTAVGKRYTTNENLPATRIDAYMEFGTALWKSFNLTSHTIDLRFDIMNLFNKQYCVVARYPMPGRSWKATIAYKF